jgi:hypothetical protein
MGDWISKHAKVIILLFAFSLGVFFINYRYNVTGDTAPAELLPISLINESNFDFNEFSKDSGYGYWFTSYEGRTVSKYPIVPGLLNLPVYLIAHSKGVDLYTQRGWLSQISASIIAALSAVFMYLCLTNLCKKNTAILFTFAFVFGTTVWSVASTGMWQHGPSVLFITIALALITRSKTNLPAYAGFFVGMAVFNRPTNIVIALPLTAYVFFKERENLKYFLFFAAIPAICLFWYSYTYFGSITALGQGNGGADEFSTPLLTGLAGILFSPNRGILAFSPMFIFGLVYLAWAFTKKAKPIEPYIAIALILIVLVYAKWRMWWGGWSFGYRIVTESVPLLIVMTARCWERFIVKKKLLKIMFLLFLFISIYIQFLGARYYQCGFNYSPDSIDFNKTRLWDYKNGEIVRCSKNFWNDVKSGFVPALPKPYKFNNWSRVWYPNEQ